LAQLCRFVRGKKSFAFANQTQNRNNENGGGISTLGTGRIGMGKREGRSHFTEDLRNGTGEIGGDRSNALAELERKRQVRRGANLEEGKKEKWARWRSNSK